MARPKSTTPTLSGEGRKIGAYVPLEVYRELKRQAYERAMATNTTVTVSTILRELIDAYLPTGSDGASAKGGRHKARKNENHDISPALQLAEPIDGAAAAHPAVGDVDHGRVQVSVAQEQLDITGRLAGLNQVCRNQMAQRLWPEAFAGRLAARRADHARDVAGVPGDAGVGTAKQPSGLERAA